MKQSPPRFGGKNNLKYLLLSHIHFELSFIYNIHNLHFIYTITAFTGKTGLYVYYVILLKMYFCLKLVHSIYTIFPRRIF